MSESVPVVPQQGPQQDGLEERERANFLLQIRVLKAIVEREGDPDKLACLASDIERWRVETQTALRNLRGMNKRVQREIRLREQVERKLAALSASRIDPPPQDEDESLHTGDDERLDAVTNIVAGLEAMRDDPDANADITFDSIIEDCHVLDALLLATIKRERSALTAIIEDMRQEAGYRGSGERHSKFFLNQFADRLAALSASRPSPSALKEP